MSRDAVIIVGGGPVGLAGALELARFGVPSVVLEQHDSTSWHPKTRNFNTRTMEIARGWGRLVYQRLRAVDTPPGWKSPIRFFDTVVGTQFGQIETQGFEGPGPGVSPALPVMSSQELIEAILRDAADVTGMVDLRFGHQVTEVVSGWRDSDAGAAVQVQVVKTGEAYTLSGRGAGRGGWRREPCPRPARRRAGRRTGHQLLRQLLLPVATSSPTWATAQASCCS